jgi:L-fuculose-phosphate aldolase
MTDSISAAGETALRDAVLLTARVMSQRGLSPGRTGNVSARLGDGMLITPSGIAYNEMDTDDIVAVSADGTVPANSRKASSEWRFHLAAYQQRPDMQAIVHTHSMHATVLACAHKSIPAFHYMVAAAGGREIPLVPYATFGTEELSRHVASGVSAHNACLMANHGQIAMGATLAAALELAADVEVLAEQYWKLLAISQAHVLPDAEMDRVIERFKSYGQKAQAPATAKM